MANAMSRGSPVVRLSAWNADLPAMYSAGGLCFAIVLLVSPAQIMSSQDQAGGPCHDPRLQWCVQAMKPSAVNHIVQR